MRKLYLFILITITSLSLSGCSSYTIDTSANGILSSLLFISIGGFLIFTYSYIEKRNYNNFTKGLKVRKLPHFTFITIIVVTLTVIAVFTLGFKVSPKVVDPVPFGLTVIDPIDVSNDDLVLYYQNDEIELYRDKEIDFPYNTFYEGMLTIQIVSPQEAVSSCAVSSITNFYIKYDNQYYTVTDGCSLGLLTRLDLNKAGVPVHTRNPSTTLELLNRTEIEESDIDELKTLAKVNGFNLFLNEDLLDSNIKTLQYINTYPFMLSSKQNQELSLNNIGVKAYKDGYVYQVQDLVDNGHITTVELYEVYLKHIEVYYQLNDSIDWITTEFTSTSHFNYEEEIYKITYSTELGRFTVNIEDGNFSYTIGYNAVNNTLVIHHYQVSGSFIDIVSLFDNAGYCYYDGVNLNCSDTLTTLPNINDTREFVFELITYIEQYTIDK